MVKTPHVDVDLLITHGDEAIWVKGRGDSLEVYNQNILFFLRSFRKTLPVTYTNYSALDKLLNRIGLSVVLKTSYIRITVMGVKAKNWVKYIIRYILPDRMEI
jgi:hypothetical protein